MFQSMRFRILESALRTATQTVAGFKPIGKRGLQLILRVSAASGTGGLTVKIRATDLISGEAVELLADAAPIIATGTFAFVLHPDRGAAAHGVRIAVAGQIPRDWDVQVVHGDASSYTYSVSGELLP